MTDEGGESPVVFNRDLKRDLDPDIMEKFRKEGIRYSRNMQHSKHTEYISWQDTFEVTTEDVCLLFLLHFSREFLINIHYFSYFLLQPINTLWCLDVLD